MGFFYLIFFSVIKEMESVHLPVHFFHFGIAQILSLWGNVLQIEWQTCSLQFNHCILRDKAHAVQNPYLLPHNFQTINN